MQKHFFGGHFSVFVQVLTNLLRTDLDHIWEIKSSSILPDRFSKTLSSIRESAAVAAGSSVGMVRSASSMSNANESPVVATKSQLLKSSSVEGIRKDVSGGEYMWTTGSREQGEEPLVPFVIAREKTLPRWSSWGASYQKESIHLEKHDILIRFLKIFEPCVVWVCLNVLEAVGSFLDFDTKPSYIQLHLPSFWIWYRNF